MFCQKMVDKTGGAAAAFDPKYVFNTINNHLIGCREEEVVLIAPLVLCMNSNFMKYRVEPRSSGIVGQVPSQGVCAIRPSAAELHMKMSGTEGGPLRGHGKRMSSSYPLYPTHPFTSRRQSFFDITLCIPSLPSTGSGCACGFVLRIGINSSGP